MKQKEQNMLWGLSGGRCAKCNTELIRKAADGTWYHTGKQAHNAGRSVAGPRGESAMSPEEREKAANRVLLCGDCHTGDRHE